MPSSTPRTMAVFCDETGTHDCDYFAWGSIWCPANRVDELNRAVDAIAGRRRSRHEIGWKHANNRGAYYRDVATWFFQQNWVCFQSLFVRKEDMRIFGKRADHIVAFQKLLCTLLATQIPRFDALPGGPRRFDVYVDQVSETTRELTDKEFRILSAASRKRMRRTHEAVRTFHRIDSRSQRGIQLADLLVGALRAAWEHPAARASRRGRLQKTIADGLGWSNLRAYTPPNLKFNVWLHSDSYATSPFLAMREVRWRFPAGDPERSFERLNR